MNPGRRFEGRNAVVTGAARGIGLAVAARLASEGARIAIWDVDAAAAQKSAQSLGAQHRADAVDIADEASVNAATDAVYDAFGRVDILVNNAGILGPVAPLWEQKPADFRRVIDINLIGMYLVCRAIVPRMRGQAGPLRGPHRQCFFDPGKRRVGAVGRLWNLQGRRDRADENSRQGTGG